MAAGVLLFLVLSTSASFAGRAPHPDSLSRSRLEVSERTARLTLRFQTLSAIEALPSLDADADGRLDEAELAAGREALGDYVLERWRLLQPPFDAETRTAIPGGLDSARLLPNAFEGPLTLQWMSVHVTFESATELAAFTVESRLFSERDPFHRDFLSLLYRDEPEVRVLFEAEKERWDFEPSDVRRPGVIAFFFGLGLRHILEGYDHLAFLLMLIVAAPRLRSLVGVVTAFTVAHSITLAAAALNPDGMLDRIPDRFVELAIALSIAYVAAENLMRPKPHAAWIEAFGFGLLHGLGFAGFLGDALAGETLMISALFGFNLGVEAGQLVVVACVSTLIVLVARARRARAAEEGAEVRQALVSRPVGVSLSAIVCVISLYWFAQRAGWTA